MINIENLNYSIKNKEILSNISLELSEGKTLAILGHNGAGKTTLIKCILQLLNYNGHIYYDFNPNNIYNYINVQMQTTTYEKNVKVIELCKLHKSLTKSNIDLDQLLNDFELKEFKHTYANSLSGGEKQKLSILLTLINQPKIIIFDEITTGLDIFARKKIWSLIKKIKNSYNLTIILTSHFLEEIEVLSDDLIIMEQGKIQYNGSVSKFKSKVLPSNKYISFVPLNINNEESELLTEVKKLSSTYYKKDNEIIIPLNESNEIDTLNTIKNLNVANIQVNSYSFEDAFVKEFGFLLDDTGGKES